MDKNQQIQHFLNRACFGARPWDAQRYKSIEDCIGKEFGKARKFKKLTPLVDIRSNKRVGVLRAVLQLLKSRSDILELNAAWLQRMTSNAAPLRERMTLFWHDHFATASPFAVLMQAQNNTLRKHALGNFRELLHAVAKDPAMIMYLNNQQNTKRAPNENFAREVMELFTLGEGNGYTEKDIKEVARAFTGWRLNDNAFFEFDEKKHDNREKTIFGRTGSFKGEEVLDMLLDNPQTANYIAGKVYRYFVNETPDETIAKALGDRFFASNYDIEDLMLTLFSSSWFYEDNQQGAIIKSPVDLLVFYKKLFNVRKPYKELFGKMQKVLGQVLFRPPNVAGWKGGRAWIDSTSLVLRMNMPLMFFGSPIDIETAGEFDLEMTIDKKRRRKLESVRVEADWKKLEQHYKKEKDLIPALLNDFISCNHESTDLDYFKQQLSETASEEQIKWGITRVMSYPEFQLK